MTSSPMTFTEVLLKKPYNDVAQSETAEFNSMKSRLMIPSALIASSMDLVLPLRHSHYCSSNSVSSSSLPLEKDPFFNNVYPTAGDSSIYPLGSQRSESSAFLDQQPITLTNSALDASIPPVRQLASSSVNTGWCSAKYCNYPQWTVFRLGPNETKQDPLPIHAVQILFHHFKIPSIVEIWIAHVKNMHELDGFSSHDNLGLFNASIKWDRLGHVVPSTNYSSHFKARELKTIPIQFTANLIKFVFQKPFENIFNLWHQVSFLEVRFFGPSTSNASSASLHSATTSLPFDISPFASALSFISNEKKKCVLEENYIRAEELKILHDNLSDLVRDFQKLYSAKEEACLKENYVHAEQLKQQLKSSIQRFYKLTLDHGFLVDSSTGHTSSTPQQNTSRLHISSETPSPKLSPSMYQSSNAATISTSFSTPFPLTQKSISGNFHSHPSRTISPSSPLKYVNTPKSASPSFPQMLSEKISSSFADILDSSQNLDPISIQNALTSPISSIPQLPTHPFPLSFAIESLETTASSFIHTSSPRLSNTLSSLSLENPDTTKSFFPSQPPETSFSKSSSDSHTNSPNYPLSQTQIAEYAACIEVVGPQLVSFFLAKEFDTKEKGLRKIYEILSERLDAMDGNLVLKASFIFVDKTLMDARERVACWSFQIWRMMIKLEGLHTFWQLTQSLFTHLLTRAGDSNLRVSKAAHELAVILITHKPTFVIPFVLKSFPPMVQWRGIKARFHLIADTLDDVGLSVYDPSALKSLISEYISHTHHEVRELANQVLMCLAQWFDVSSLEPCLEAIPQRFHRQALRVKLQNVQRRSASVIDRPVPLKNTSFRRAVTPTVNQPKKKSWTRWFGKSLSPPNSTVSNSNPSELNVGGPSFSLNTMACIFCDEAHPDFNLPGNLDIHYLKECPLLSECPYCETIIEIPQYREHHFNECAAPPKSARFFDTDGICPLCHSFLQGKSELHLLRHLLTGGGCPKSKRKPKPGVKYTSKLKQF